MEQVTIKGRTYRVERIERQYRQQGPVLLHGPRGAVYGTLRYFANREQEFSADEPMFLINGRTGQVDPLGGVHIRVGDSAIAVEE